MSVVHEPVLQLKLGSKGLAQSPFLEAKYCDFEVNGKVACVVFQWEPKKITLPFYLLCLNNFLL